MYQDCLYLKKRSQQFAHGGKKLEDWKVGRSDIKKRERQSERERGGAGKRREKIVEKGKKIRRTKRREVVSCGLTGLFVMTIYLELQGNIAEGVPKACYQSSWRLPLSEILRARGRDMAGKGIQRG